MKKIYFKFLLIAFSVIFLTIVFVFYLGYLKREQLRKERLRFIEIREIFSILKENSPLNQSKLPLLKEIEKSYGVNIFVKTNKKFHYISDEKMLSPKVRHRLLEIKRFPKKRKMIAGGVFRDKKRILPDFNFRDTKITYLIDKRTKILRGVKFETPELQVFLLKKTSNSLLAAFFTLITILFLLSGILLYLIRKWYVTPLIELENSIKSIENNLNSPELFTDSSGTLTPVFNALNDLKRRIIHEINSKEDMLRDISHDLKTPLSRIKLATEFIENEKIKKGIKEDISELENLINQILDIYTVKKENCKTDLNNFLEKIPEKYKEIKFSIKCNEKIIIPVCEEDLKRIFYNLVDNSIKFATTSEGVFIEAYNENNSVLIKYTDCKTKGEKPDLNRMFDYFYKSDKARNKSINRGFGLGLSIVKKITEQYSGSISVSYSNCNGLEFVFKFPLN
ncbi:two-component system, OmpR family, osmolarity sensor histidine kinase [Thermotomaculum hydrothermale]|uniref:histidine kinase n=1 Tax=Thermotomaculum hydrothermale TaxID=981385 RepID=A0A7R6PNT0_9BACT|nr:HAMP domain-containing sensor histidine kinase [Thermotomaculum hydrothermale]BBB32526.1 two-component system, OmpR family, osmolarity sensor histidine kinase [Thermotomaculum hydrothermale]